MPVQYVLITPRGNSREYKLAGNSIKSRYIFRRLKIEKKMKKDVCETLSVCINTRVESRSIQVNNVQAIRRLIKTLIIYFI